MQQIKYINPKQGKTYHIQSHAMDIKSISEVLGAALRVCRQWNEERDITDGGALDQVILNLSRSLRTFERREE